MSAIIERPRRHSAAPTCGFTLVELLVILAILSLMAGIVFPSVEKAMRRQSFVDSARRVELGLRSARAAAVGGGMAVRFVAARDGHGFRYAGREDRLPETATIALPDRGIQFFADGSAIGGPVEVSDGRFSQRLFVDDALGLIERAR
ncbi:pilus assembly FimT family protein [Sphingomonas psychrotolerans]|nr:prepilin-type N-terminal cleavage/methylation domain-containing protein [Sphingomonas psychrotolerans]